MAVAVAVCFLFGLGSSFYIFFGDNPPIKGLASLVTILAFVAGGVILKRAEKNMQEALVKLDVVPLTRSNAGDLRAPEVLVRASQQPDQAPQTELLRAAGQGLQTPSEQLLRATEGKQTE